jgi:small subunit ribosomal protein S9
MVKKEKKAEKKKDLMLKVGKRKRAIARATIKPGTGKIRVNSIPIEEIGNETFRSLIREPLLLIGDEWKKYDYDVNVRGGGVVGQAEAVRQSIAKGLADALGERVKKIFIEYNRNLLAYDPRRTEPHKPPHSSWGPRRYKQRSKR